MDCRDTRETTADQYTPQPWPTACVFCEAEGTTREHIYREAYRWWINRGAPQGFRVDFETSESGKFSKGRNSFDHWVKVVCVDCNTKWMRILEENLQGAVLALFKGKPFEFDAATARQIAYWACKTTIMRSYAEDDRAISAADHRWVYDHREQRLQPENWVVLLGQSDYDGMCNLSNYYRRGPEEDQFLIQQHTYVAGSMVLITVGLSARDRKLLRVKHDLKAAIGRTRANLVQLWPEPKAFSWPTKPLYCPPEDFHHIIDFAIGLGDTINAEFERRGVPHEPERMRHFRNGQLDPEAWRKAPRFWSPYRRRRAGQLPPRGP